MKIAQNIRYLRGLKLLSQEELAGKLKITRSRLGAYEEERNEPPIEILIKLSEFFHIAIDALVKGDLRKTDPEALMKVGKNRILFPVIIDKDNNEQIEVVTIRASAGYLNGYGDPEYMEKLPLMKLPFNVSGKQRAFPIKGDSMLPIKSGSYIVGKFVESISDIKNGTTYVLLTKNDGITYKRVFKKQHELVLHADNTEYSPYTVKNSEVLEIWEFVCALDASDKKQDDTSLQNVMSALKNLQTEVKGLKKK